MITPSSHHPRAFAVIFKDLEKWSVSSYVRKVWQWPKEYIRPLSVALQRKREVVDRTIHHFSSLNMISLSFGGDITHRDLHGKNDFKGQLFFAAPGDVIYSKIDVRNGAIGIIPDDMRQVVVSSEFPVYEVVPNVAIPLYVKLLFRTKHFRQIINGLISGTSGRKRVQPEVIEKLLVPLPPIASQLAIVNTWSKAQSAIAEKVRTVEQMQAEMKRRF